MGRAGRERAAAGAGEEFAERRVLDGTEVATGLTFLALGGGVVALGGSLVEGSGTDEDASVGVLVGCGSRLCLAGVLTLGYMRGRDAKG